MLAVYRILFFWWQYSFRFNDFLYMLLLHPRFIYILRFAPNIAYLCLVKCYYSPQSVLETLTLKDNVMKQLMSVLRHLKECSLVDWIWHPSIRWELLVNVGVAPWRLYYRSQILKVRYPKAHTLAHEKNVRCHVIVGEKVNFLSHCFLTMLNGELRLPESPNQSHFRAASLHFLWQTRGRDHFATSLSLA